MPSADDISWFKSQFSGDLVAAIAGTPFDVDMLTAIACQETGYIWQRLRKKGIARDRILELCVGDTLDSRSAFPRSKAELLAKPNGQQMFDIAHAALVDMAQYITEYKGPAGKANKFCHGFGVFQYDIQHFTADPDYFLERRYTRFDASVRKCVEELKSALRRLKWQDRASLSDLEEAAVAIAYNRGSYEPSKGLKQGYKDDGGKYYGEYFFDYLRLAHTVAVAGGPAPEIAAPADGQAIVAPPTPVAAIGLAYQVDTDVTVLRVRSTPEIVAAKPLKNVIGQLPDGQVVRAISGKAVNGFLEIEATLNGARLHGFCSTKYLKKLGEQELAPAAQPAASPPTSGIVAVYTPRPSGSVATRRAPAGALSLNEPGQPKRTGMTPDELKKSIAQIIDWLAVDRATNKRYQPHDGLTYCNIYAHDYCYLCGVYLPRVWWTPGAIEALARGDVVEPRYGKTIDEVRANDLFRWLRDFGMRFGWRQTSTLTKLQTEVDQGAVGLIVARRKEDGRSGHIVMVVPETNTETAKRNAAGDVVAPLQSQAGVTNFRYGTGRLDWWKGAQFAESAFWLHA